MFDKLYLLFASVALILPGQAVADSATDLARKTQNPISDLISVPFENNANFNAGPDDKVLNVLNIKPVIPMKLNDEWNLINRVIIPLISQPGVDGASIGRKNGLGDITYQAFFSPNPKPGGMIWGVGPQIQIPTHSNSRLGNQRWAAGPNVVVLDMKGKTVKGFLLSQIWDVTNSKDDDISMMTFQPFYNYNFGEGWYAVTNPVITADWEAMAVTSGRCRSAAALARSRTGASRRLIYVLKPSVMLSGRQTVLTTIFSSLCSSCFRRENNTAKTG